MPTEAKEFPDAETFVYPLVLVNLPVATGMRRNDDLVVRYPVRSMSLRRAMRLSACPSMSSRRDVIDSSCLRSDAVIGVGHLLVLALGVGRAHFGALRHDADAVADQRKAAVGGGEVKVFIRRHAFLLGDGSSGASGHPLRYEQIARFVNSDR